MRGKIKEEPVVKGLKNQGKLDPVLSGEPESTVTFVGPTKRLHVEAHISNV